VTKKIICVGHAALDRVYRIGAFPPRPSKVRALEHIESGGGMAANAAAAIATLGGTAELWSRVGADDAGQKIRNGLKHAGVDVRYVESFDDGRSSTSVVIVGDGGERMVVGTRDINMPAGTSWLPLERVNATTVVLADLRWMEATRAIFARAKAANVPTVLDADLGGRESLTELLTQTDYAIFSEEALSEYQSGHDLKSRLERVMLLGPRHVGVTLGSAGYTWLDTFGGGSCPGFEVDVIDTTGAGDAFHGAFAFALSEQRPIAECARFACATAALKCSRLGARAGLPKRDDVEAFLSTRV
jgi:sulfofructose kinase